MRTMRAFVLLALVAPNGAIDNGLGRTPPMGWRSWNLYGENVDQTLIEGIMDGMVARKRLVDGVPTSLCDLGYCDVGLDDNWQECGAGADGYNFHGASGQPIVNLKRFPSMKNMTDHAHMLGLTAGWYGNNCICAEKKKPTASMYFEDVEALVHAYNFDAIKLDGCGSQRDLDLYSVLINKSRPERPVMIENCHWGQTVPNATWCPWNFFRTSGDVRASYGSVVGNLLTTVQWAQNNLSQPGCWAYPDMLEVGCKHGPGGAGDPGLSSVEARTHFGAWCIVSSPLTLSHDVNNDTIMDEIWPLISNKDAIAVNQAWAGHSGSPFQQSNTSVQLEDYNMLLGGVLTPHTGAVPSWQFFYKPLGSGRTAVFVANHDSVAHRLVIQFADVPGVGCMSKCHVRDIWKRKDVGTYEDGMPVHLAPHDSAFVILTAPSEANVDSVLYA